MSEVNEVQWTKDNMIEVNLKEPDDFLKVRETLTRIGVASRKEKKLYQSCHILHKKGQYYIVHFKELFALDGKPANITKNDVERRNRIAKLLTSYPETTISAELRPELCRYLQRIICTRRKESKPIRQRRTKTKQNHQTII